MATPVTNVTGVAMTAAMRVGAGKKTDPRSGKRRWGSMHFLRKLGEKEQLVAIEAAQFAGQSL